MRTRRTIDRSVAIGALCLFVALLVGLTTPVLAGKNARGALVVHTAEMPGTSFYSPCDDDYDDPGTCENASTQVVENLPMFVWLLAAFPDGSDPGVTVIYFGIEHNLPAGFVQAGGMGFCGPVGTLEIPDPGWPDDPQNAGNSVAFGSPVAGNRLFPFYWFGVSDGGFSGAYLGSGINPTGGYAGFVSDDSPGILDEVFNFGRVRWFEPGFNDCPQDPEPGACCFVTGVCEYVLLEDCEVLGGDFLGDGTGCDPNPCPQFPGACCFVDGHCEIFTGPECMSYEGEFLGPEFACDPNPCFQPTQACCFEFGSCLDLSVGECEEAGGTPMGYQTNCGMVVCRPPTMGACCLEDWSCQVVGSLEDCETLGGMQYLEGYACDPNPCIPDAVEETSWGRIKAAYR